MTSTAPDSSSTELFSLGIEEVEPWVCEDTFENRAILRKEKFAWAQVTDEGEPTNLIRVFSNEALIERRDTVWATRKPLMKDPRNRYSEYLEPDEYPMDADVPRWLKLRLRKWEDQDREGIAPEARQPFPVRCETVRHDGTRCWNWAGNPKKSLRCKQHLPWHAETELRNAQVARLKLIQAGPAMADNLEALALHAESEPVRLKATTEILDRIGVRGGVEIDHHVEVEQVDPSVAIRERLARLATRAIPAIESPILEAEVVTDEPG